MREVFTAFSGGKDSVTLLYLLKEFRNEQPFQLTAAYFNHRIRKDAEREQLWVEDFCGKMGVKLVTGSADVPDFKKQHRLNLEHAASILRYRFLLNLAGNRDNVRVATAHSRSDQVETFFIKLIRGSGSRGLGAIHRKKGIHIIRPLLIFSEEEILAFLQRNGIDYYRDPSNLDDRFLRNRVRSALLPRIREIDAAAEGHIADTVAILQEEENYLSGQAVDFLSRHLILDRILPVPPLEDQHLALRRHILREYIRQLKGDLLGIELAHIDTLLQRMTDSRGVSLPGLDLKFHKGFIFPAALSVPSYRYELTSAADLFIKEINTRIRIEETGRFSRPADNFSITIPLNAVRFPLIIRNSRKSDRYVKINTGYSLKVDEMIRESGLPSELRPLRPLLTTADDRIIWVAGAPLADPFKIQPTTPPPFLKISISG